MKRGQGKKKGNAFERVACKRLSLWLTAGKEDHILWRSAMSGGRATVRAKKGTMLAHSAGDISAVAEAGRQLLDVFYIECKFYKDLGAARLVFDGAGGKLHDFWMETVVQARRYNKLPMLIAKQNQFGAVVVIESDVLAAFELGAHLRFLNGDGNIVAFDYFVKQAPVAALKRWRARRAFPQKRR